MAYRLKADVFRERALCYQVEADFCRVDSDLTTAITTEANADQTLHAYREKEEAIRARHPDDNMCTRCFFF